jgi:CheY-like chemotaxis protein
MQTLPEELAIIEQTTASDRQEPRRRARMLVMEDTHSAGASAAAIGGWIDMDVEAVENDRIAGIMATISLAEGRPYDVVLVDAQTPNAYGAGIVRWLREQGWQVPIIGMGADAGAGDRERFLAAGCDDFIEKPLTNPKLQAALARLAKPTKDETAPVTAAGDKTAGGATTHAPVAADRKTPDEQDRTVPVAASADHEPVKLHARVLVVDDALCMQTIVGRFLQKMGVVVDMANDGEIACEMAMQSLNEGEPYDVILMDIQMPRMNGKQAAKWLRENGWQGPIVAVTGHNTAKDHAAITTAGCNSFLAKPVTLATLEKTLSQCLKPADVPQ